MAIDFQKLKRTPTSRYLRQIERVRHIKGYVKSIEDTVEKTVDNLSKGANRLAIYGEPQSGKTEMMIALSARLFDEGNKCIIILVNDSVDVLSQNYDRFLESGIVPTPKNLGDLEQTMDLLKSKELLIITKKNQSNLRNLLEYLKKTNNKGRILIDDEADYATPNAKINLDLDKKTGEKDPKTVINKLVQSILDLNGAESSIYIGVTATPQRLDLNNTFNNQREFWVFFDTHPNYHGHDVFFPDIQDGQYKVPFHLEVLPDQGDNDSYLINALLRFMINVAHLNCSLPDTFANGQSNYCMLIHTSGVKEDHKHDHDLVVDTFEKLIQEKEKPGRYFEKLESLTEQMYPEKVLPIMQYIYEKCEGYAVKVVNSERDRDLEKITSVTVPKRPFTIAIGGNIVSRGVTFDNLLTMFFTRSPKHKIQTDTYVQRARMFGARGAYLDHFELHIPESLYQDWHTAFYYHRMGMGTLPSGEPIWYEDARTNAVSGSSKDKANISQDKGEVSFGLFHITEQIKKLTADSLVGFSSLEQLLKLLPDGYIPNPIIRTIESMKPNGDASVVVHKTKSLLNYKSLTPEDKTEIKRGKRGLFYGEDAKDFPKALHHFQIFFNEKDDARMIYKFVEKGRGIKIIRWDGRK
jgi:DNA polymerase III delta prime subunit